MRKLIAAAQITVDGIMEAPEQWSMPYFTPELGAAVGAAMAQADALLMGRVLYQEWAAYWPAQGPENQMAPYMNTIPKYVVSTTLDSVDDWSNTTLLTGDAAQAIRDLKQQPGKNISISGSATLVRSVLQLGLLDELQLIVFPLVVGHGKRLFAVSAEQQRLTLRDSTSFSSGVVLLTYQPA